MTGATEPDLPGYVDPRLWFEMDGCRGPHYLVDGSPHIIGRLYAYRPVKRDTTRVSKSELTAMSTESRYFIRGYLSGSEPPPPLDDDGQRDLVAWDSWERAVRMYHETGIWRRGR